LASKRVGHVVAVEAAVANVFHTKRLPFRLRWHGEPAREAGGVEVARLGVVRARLGDVIDADHLEAAGCLGIGGFVRAVNDGGDSTVWPKFPAVQFAVFKIFDQAGDETFHAVILRSISTLLLADWRRGCISPPREEGGIRSCHIPGATGGLKNSEHETCVPTSRVRQRCDRGCPTQSFECYDTAPNLPRLCIGDNLGHPGPPTSW
jgi:hypothetical protein